MSIERRKMTAAQKAALEPFASMYAGIFDAVDNLSESELETLLDACAATSSVNCWFATYEAAEIVSPLASAALRRLRRNKAEAEEEADE